MGIGRSRTTPIGVLSVNEQIPRISRVFLNRETGQKARKHSVGGRSGGCVACLRDVEPARRRMGEFVARLDSPRISLDLLRQRFVRSMREGLPVPGVITWCGTRRTGSPLQAREGAQLPRSWPRCPASEQPAHQALCSPVDDVVSDGGRATRTVPGTVLGVVGSVSPRASIPGVRRSRSVIVRTCRSRADSSVRAVP
jgi:hypothetical protein